MLNENELYLLLLESPEKGLEKIMDKYMSYVYTIVYGKLSMLCTKQDIEECVSSIFCEVYKTRYNIDLEKGSLKSYLAVLSKRNAIDTYRKLRNNLNNVSLDETEHDWIPDDTDIEKEIIQKETGDILIEQIHALGEPDSQIIIRKYYFGQTSKIIGKALGLKENTVNKKVSRALVKLKEALGGVL